jgi:hypothetical protein
MTAAEQRLREVFARYPARAVDGCPCCVSADDRAGLAAGSRDALQRFAFKAMTTWGDDRDFRHYVPELFALGPGYVDQVAAKLRYAQWWTWPDDERAAVRGYLLALWHGTREHFSDVLDVVLTAGLGVAEVLDPLWLEPSAPVLAELVHEVLHSSSQRPELVAWLRDPRTVAVLEEAFFTASDGDTAARYSQAVDEVSWLPEP